MKTMFAITHVNKDGLRVLTFANQGRNHHETRGGAQDLLDAIRKQPQSMRAILGDRADSLEVRAVECYDHGDAVRSVLEFEPSDAAYACFDYLMNTRRTYDLLGEAIGYLERLAKRERATEEQIITEFGRTKYTGGFSLAHGRRWLRVLREAISKGVADWMRHFPEESACWFNAEGHRLVGCNEADIIRLALDRRESWGTR